MEQAINYRFDHRHLVVEDVPTTVAFYVSVLGARKIHEFEYDGVPVVNLEMDGISITVSGQLEKGIGDHIGFAVDDFEAAVAQLGERGVTFVAGPTDLGAVKSAFFRDAAGTLLELVCYVDSD